MALFSRISVCMLALLFVPAATWAQGQRGFAGGSRGASNHPSGYRGGFHHGINRSSGPAAGEVRGRSGFQTGARARSNARGTATPAGVVGGHRNKGHLGRGTFPNRGGRGHRSSFADRLGNNVGLRALPPVATHPGVGNINRPGVAPNGSPSHIPNINRPGGGRTHRGFTGPAYHHKSPYRSRIGGYSRQRGYGSIIVFYYGIPYAVPSYYGSYSHIPYGGYSGGYNSTPAPSQPPQTAAPGAPGDPVGNVHLWPGMHQSPEQPTTQQPDGSLLTLLAFQDHTIVAVTDYWLEGNILYYQTSYGMQGSIPLDRLDLPLTQQLNRERNIPFVLESRP